jgi:pimeloyl-ACP methyl ester carboxylesterase
MSTTVNGPSHNGARPQSWSQSWTHFSVDRRSLGYCRVTFDHPPINTITATTVAELAELVGLIEQDSDLNVVVFDSANPDFYLAHYDIENDPGAKAGREAWLPMQARTEDRDAPTTWATREAQYDAVCSWGIPDHAALQRLGAIRAPVFVANGDSDPMILPRYSYLLAGLIPQAQVKIYPDSAHGFLFQHHAEFALDVEAFLAA